MSIGRLTGKDNGRRIIDAVAFQGFGFFLDELAEDLGAKKF